MLFVWCSPSGMREEIRIIRVVCEYANIREKYNHMSFEDLIFFKYVENNILFENDMLYKWKFY